MHANAPRFARVGGNGECNAAHSAIGVENPFLHRHFDCHMTPLNSPLTLH